MALGRETAEAAARAAALDGDFRKAVLGTSKFWQSFQYVPIYGAAGQVRNSVGTVIDNVPIGWEAAKALGRAMLSLPAPISKARMEGAGPNLPLPREGLSHAFDQHMAEASSLYERYKEATFVSPDTISRQCNNISATASGPIKEAVKRAKLAFPHTPTRLPGGVRLPPAPSSASPAGPISRQIPPNPRLFDQPCEALTLIRDVSEATANWGHYQPLLTMWNGSKYVLDWWLTLDPDNPLIWRFEDWVDMPKAPEEYSGYPGYVVELMRWMALAKPLNASWGRPAFEGYK